MKKILTSLVTVTLKSRAMIRVAILIAGLLSFYQVADAATKAYYVKQGSEVFARSAPGKYVMGRLYPSDRMDIQYVDPHGWAYGYAYGNVNRCVWAQYTHYGAAHFQTNNTIVSTKCRTENKELDTSEFTNGEIWTDPVAAAAGGGDGVVMFLSKGTHMWDNWSWNSAWGNHKYKGYAPAGSRFKIRYTTKDGVGLMARLCEPTTCKTDTGWVFIQRTAINCGLNPGEGLGNGESLISCDRRFRLTMQTDGNLVLYQEGAGALWWTGTQGNSGRNVSAFMQTDGNLVVYANPWSSWVPLWHAGTWGQPGSRLALQDDGNLVIYNPSNNWIWASHTCCR